MGVPEECMGACMRPENLTINPLNDGKTHDYAVDPDLYSTLCDGMDKLIEQCVVDHASKFCQYLSKQSKIHFIINYIYIVSLSLCYMQYNILDKCKKEGESCGRQPFLPFTDLGTCCEGKMCKYNGSNSYGKCVVEGRHFRIIDFHYKCL